MIKYALGVSALIAVPTAAIAYKKRIDNLNDPILHRALINLKKDQRILDFCGEDIKPSWVITKKKGKENENWVKFDLKVGGYSGKLQTTVIGDYLKHAEL